MNLRLKDWWRHPIRTARLAWFTRSRLWGNRGAAAAWRWISVRDLSQREKDYALTLIAKREP